MDQIPIRFCSEKISFNNGEIAYYPNFFSKDYYPLLRNDLKWHTDKIHIFGKTHPIPRLHCWYADQGVLYEYSGISIPQSQWTATLIEIKQNIENQTTYSFNGMLGNLYRSGDDYVSWHSDDESSLGSDPVIACASFGETRVFSLRNKLTKETIRLNLEDRSLLIMLPPTQKDWEHQINKCKTIAGQRISLTFRFVHQ